MKGRKEAGAKGSQGVGEQQRNQLFSLSPPHPFSPAHPLPFAPAFECRPGCGACCIALSISSPIPGMLDGKPAGVRCVQLTDDNLCKLFGLPERPAVCVRLRPSAEMCGETREEAMVYLTNLEILTLP